MIFGSQAARFHFPDFREPKDIDFMSKEALMTRGEQNYWIPTFQWIIDNNKHPKYIDPEFLYAIKGMFLGFRKKLV